MGWETRNGRQYYYEAERVGGRVVKKYVGRGQVAELIARLNALEADKRKWAKIDREVAAARRSRPSPALKLVGVADAVLAVWLPACGWHRPNRGSWRRKRGFVVSDGALAERKPLDSWDADTLWRANGPLPPELVPEGGKPKPAAVAAYLMGHPTAVALYGDLGRRVVARLADAAGGDGTLAASAIKAKAAGLRAALSGDSPTAVELLLAERAVVCWAACHQYELLYYGSLDKSRSVKDHEFHERRLTSAHRRLLAALKTLAAVRRIKLPTLVAILPAAAPPRPVTPLPTDATGD